MQFIAGVVAGFERHKRLDQFAERRVGVAVVFRRDGLIYRQVNAVYKTPGGYRNADYLKAGGLMTLLFLFVAVSITYLWYA